MKFLCLFDSLKAYEQGKVLQFDAISEVVVHLKWLHRN